MSVFNPLLRMGFKMFLRSMCLLWAMVTVPLAIVLLCSCVTIEGYVFSIAALALGIGPFLWGVGLGNEKKWLRTGGVGCMAIWLVMTAWLVWKRPDGHTSDSARVSNLYSDGGWHYQSNALGTLLPEVDQFMMGFKLVPIVDPYFTRQQGETLSRLTRDIYAELEADSEFHALGSVMPSAYRELRGQTFDYGHYFLYRSPKLDQSKPVSSLVFLHGSGGNFKAYLWLMSRMADDLGMVVIAPSYGMGNWDDKHGPSAVISALDDVGRKLKLDGNNIHLVGLSNGGLGVSRTAASIHGRRFTSLTFISPVFDQVAINSPLFATFWIGKPVLVITGRDDDRVPFSHAEESASMMKTAGARVDMIPIDGADHFMLFSHRGAVIGKMTDWLSARIRSGAQNQNGLK